jgi:ATP-dependent RNA helicase RhlB
MAIDSKEDSLVGEDTEVGTEIQHDEEVLVEIDLIEAIQEDRDESSVTKTTFLKPAKEFSDLDLNPALRDAVTELGWTQPTPVQGLCLPHTLAGRDVAGFAQTGTGKTGVFLITVAEAILKKRAATSDAPKSPLAVVLAPTRELAVQIHEEVEKLAVKLNLKSLVA